MNAYLVKINIRRLERKLGSESIFTMSNNVNILYVIPEFAFFLTIFFICASEMIRRNEATPLAAVARDAWKRAQKVKRFVARTLRLLTFCQNLLALAPAPVEPPSSPPPTDACCVDKAEPPGDSA
jgi:hypothetical protein